MNKRDGLTIDLSALARNWHYLNAQLGSKTRCAAVVKAQAYGVGVSEVASRLMAEGCQHFFVSSLEEALELKPLLSAGCRLLVLSGCRAGEEQLFLEHGVHPVIISLPMFERWLLACKESSCGSAKCAVKVNTGMNRFGLEAGEWHDLLSVPENLQAAGVDLLMSHLACADEPDHPLNNTQLARFNVLVSATRPVLPTCIFSLANSAGIFLGSEFHFDLVRPGVALYGGQPQRITRDIKPVVQLQLEVLQCRSLEAGESVGYGAAHFASDACELIIVGAGYADGILRALSNNLEAVFKARRFPLVGRVSMDSLVFDVTGLPEDERPKEGEVIEILGENINVNELAEKAGTISYEILTALGQRYARRYLP